VSTSYKQIDADGIIGVYYNIVILNQACNYINLIALTTLPVEKLFGKLRINSKCDNTSIVAKEVIEKSLLLDALKANIGIDT